MGRYWKQEMIVLTKCCKRSNAAAPHQKAVGIGFAFGIAFGWGLMFAALGAGTKITSIFVGGLALTAVALAGLLHARKQDHD